MLRADDSRRERLREACYSLLTLMIGFLSIAIMVLLVYFTSRSLVGNTIYCTLWTDIPGRLAIFLALYYAAGVCGFFPIAESFRINCLPPPFIIYRLESWSNLFRNIRLLFTFNSQVYEVLANDPEISPLRDESNARSYGSSPSTRELSERIPISKTDTPRKKAVRWKRVPRHRNVEVTSSSGECSLSLDSSMAGPIVPMARGKSTKPPYFTDSSLSTTGSSDKSISIAPIEILFRKRRTSDYRAKAVATACSETDTPPRTPDVESPLTSHPRMSWSLLGNANRIPPEAKALHKRHLIAERREFENHKKQKMEETAHSPKGDSEWRTDSDEFNPFEYRRFRIPIVAARGKTGFRSRTKTTPGRIGMPEKSKTKIHQRMLSCGAPHKNKFFVPVRSGSELENADQNENKCCENSPDIKYITECIKERLIMFEPGFQARGEASASRQRHGGVPSKKSNEELTSRQYIDIFPSKECTIEVSTSRQNTDNFPCKISDSEVSAPQQPIESLPCKILHGQASRKISQTSSDKNSDSDTPTNKRYIEHIYKHFPIESDASRVKTKSSEDSEE